MSFIKLINKAALKALIDHGYTDATKLDGISITSKNKKSNGKKYYAKDMLAFIAWELLGEDPDDKDFQTWKKRQKNRKKQRFSSADRD